MAKEEKHLEENQFEEDHSKLFPAVASGHGDVVEEILLKYKNKVGFVDYIEEVFFLLKFLFFLFSFLSFLSLFSFSLSILKFLHF